MHIRSNASLPGIVCPASVSNSAPLRHRLGRFLAGLLVAAATAGLWQTAALAHDYEVGSLKIEHPWSRATPGGARVAGGYMILHNRGSIADRLLSASAPVAGRVEIHEMAYRDNVMTMRALPDGLSIPARGSVVLQPGSWHLMLMELKQTLKQGDRFQATLTFERAGTVSVIFGVEAMGATAPHH